MLSVAALADWVGILATAILATTLVEPAWAKGVAFGGAIGIRLLPALVLGTVAGVIADRFDRRYTLFVCDLLRFLLFASIPLAFLVGDLPQWMVLGWMAIAIFIIEAITLVWNPAKDAALPNLVPRAKLEAANQLSLIVTYGLAPVAAALMLAGMEPLLESVDADRAWQAGAAATIVALFLNAASRLATGLVVFFGIKEISGRDGVAHVEQPALLRQFVEGWKYIGQTRLVRGLVLGILGAFAAGGIVVGTAQFYAQSLGGGNATFYLLFGLIFLGLGVGVGLGPWLIGELSRRRWFGMSIMLAAIGVIVLAVAVHLSIAVVGALLVGAGAGMAFLSGITLLGGEVGDDVRGRVFAFVHTSVRAVLMLAIAVTGPVAGAGGSRMLNLGLAQLSVSWTRVLLLVAGVFGILAGRLAFRQMDDKPGVPVLADLWGSLRGRPLSAPQPVAWAGLFVVFEGGEGAGKSTQVTRLAKALRGQGQQVVVTREPGATEFGARIRGMLLGGAHGPAAPTPRAEALLYAADRAHHVATVIRPALTHGSVVVSDRYVDSSLAYQGAGRSLPVEEVAWLSSWATGRLKPDLVVLLDVAPEVGLDRVADRGKAPDRLERESLAFHERVRDAFLDLAADEPSRYLVLDATLPPEEIAAAVLDRVGPMLPPSAPPQPPRAFDVELRSIVDQELERRG
ncbi:dTMP kinase [Natronosporangium hydrolyticum]|uniref:dTMP kinase n=1 Tax=Natronosporangium hydrolyticum TaxID=2811111 RepID=UPI001EFA12DF|nr:dTMP kinase [Natronosporangium hydrolyticum]